MSDDESSGSGTANYNGTNPQADLDSSEESETEPVILKTVQKHSTAAAADDDDDDGYDEDDLYGPAPAPAPPSAQRSEMSKSVASAVATVPRPKFDIEVLRKEDGRKPINMLVDERFGVSQITFGDGKAGWVCHHCSHQWRGINVTKILNHLSKNSGGNTGSIKPCKGSTPRHMLELYRALHSIRNATRSECAAQRSGIQQLLEFDHANGVAELKKQPGRKQAALKKVRAVLKKPPPGSIGKQPHGSNWISAGSGHFKTPSNSIQTKLTVSSPNDEACLELDHAIANFIHAHGLAFSLSEDDLFRQVIRKARLAPTSYTTPSRKMVSGTLLHSNHARVCRENDAKLIKEGRVYGIGACGDAATINKTPFVNLLASTPSHPSIPLEVVDCSEQMEDGGKKDAGYLAEQFLRHMKRLDPERNMFDLVQFDGGTNFQKAGSILEEHFPLVTTNHGAEHCMDLFFKDVNEHWVMQLLIKAHQKLYNEFGGAKHSIHATFKRNSRDHNNGTYVGMFRAAGTRMAGHNYAHLRLLGLRPVFESIMAGPECHRLKVPPMITDLLKNRSYWALLQALVQTLWASLYVLRLADTNEPCMDKLLFYVHQNDHLLEMDTKSLNKFDFPVDFTAKSVDSEEWDEMIELLRKVVGEDSNDSDSSVDSIGSTLDSRQGPLGDHVLKCWEARRGSFIHPYSVVGWLLSPCDHVMHNCLSVMVGDDHRAADYTEMAEDLVCKLMLNVPKEAPNYEQAKANLLHQWDSELQQFRDQTGAFGRERIWQSEDITQNRTWMWHKKYSMQTRVLGPVALRVTSKLLGPGSAERNWAVVDRVLTDKRCKLSPEKTSKQTLLISHYAKLKSDVAKATRSQDEKFTKSITDTDFIRVGYSCRGGDGTAGPGAPNAKPPERVRVFRAWLEDWEVENMKVNDPKVQAKFLNKCCGLH